MGVSMQFVIVSTWMFLTNRARQLSDGLAEQDVLKNRCQGERKKKSKSKGRQFAASQLIVAT